VFPVLIALSCLYCKQHMIADLVPGMLLGWTAWRFASACLLS